MLKDSNTPQASFSLSIADFLLLSIVAVYIFAGVSLAPFHGDENAYLLLSETYDSTFTDTDSRSDEMNILRFTTGSVFPFVISVARRIAGNHAPARLWSWQHSWEQNLALRNLPDPALLTLARFCSTAMAVVGIWLFFLLVRKLFASRAAAWTATLLLASHGPLLLSFRRAMQEGPKFLFLVLTIYLGMRIIQDLHQGKLLRWNYLLLGASAGLTLATKLDTIPMLAAIWIALAAFPLGQRVTSRIGAVNLLSLGAAILTSFAVFLALTPIFSEWRPTSALLVTCSFVALQLPHFRSSRGSQASVIAGLVLCIILLPASRLDLQLPLVRLYDTRKQLTELQLEHYGEQNAFSPDTYQDRLTFLLSSTFSSRIQYAESPGFEVPPLASLNQNYQSSWLSGRTGNPAIDCVIALLALLGLTRLACDRRPEDLLIINLYFVSAIVLSIVVVLSWQRYFLILQLPYVLLAGVGAALISRSKRSKA